MIPIVFKVTMMLSINEALYHDLEAQARVRKVDVQTIISEYVAGKVLKRTHLEMIDLPEALKEERSNDRQDISQGPQV